jgi:hypothetical protein
MSYEPTRCNNRNAAEFKKLRSQALHERAHQSLQLADLRVESLQCRNLEESLVDECVLDKSQPAQWPHRFTQPFQSRARRQVRGYGLDPKAQSGTPQAIDQSRSLSNETIAPIVAQAECFLLSKLAKSWQTVRFPQHSLRDRESGLAVPACVLEPCVNGGILSAGAYFGQPMDRLVDRLLDEQLEDGGWNCEAPSSTRSSFHTTICVLEGLLEYEKTGGATSAVKHARVRAQDYLLKRRMLRSLTSGQVIERRWTRFSFPTTWHYDVLRGVDYLRSAGVEPDERVAEAVELVEKRRHQNWRWPLNVLHPDRVTFDMEAGIGKASRWNTLRALRVLHWYGAELPRQVKSSMIAAAV